MKVDPATAIVAAMQEPYACLHRNYLGVDLSQHEKALRALLIEIHEAHELACDDWKTRSGEYWKEKTGQDKPRRRLEKNKLVKPPLGYDYSAFQPTEWNWEADYDRWYARERGNPGRSRKREKLPLPPLHEVYTILRRWWTSLGRKWHPKASDDVPLRDIDLRHMNHALRLFVLVARTCDPRYTVQNCLRVSTTFKA